MFLSEGFLTTGTVTLLTCNCSNPLAFSISPYVVKYYGSYFKNTDLWIVMEYCGAGSVSDIIRLRNKTVRLSNITSNQQGGS